MKNLCLFVFLVSCNSTTTTGGTSQSTVCSVDGDCADGFCGWDDSNARVCKPYGDVGDSCGGYVIPSARNVCDPALTCYQDDPTGDIPGICMETCSDNSDCTDGFCGWDNNNQRVCKPWGEEGDSCNGYVIPSARNFCDPSLTCYQDDPTGDIPGICVDACSDDSDCSDGFCGWGDAGERFCKPWGQVGDSCNGYVIPSARNFCDPALSCYQTDPTGDIPGVCVN